MVEDVYALAGQPIEIAKVGAVTGYRSVAFEQVSVDVDNVDILFGHHRLRFDGLIEVEWPEGVPSFAEPGDSGCVYFIEGLEERVAIGLHVASGDLMREDRRTRVSYGCLLHEALAQLGAQLLV